MRIVEEVNILDPFPKSGFAWCSHAYPLPSSSGAAQGFAFWWISGSEQ